MARNTKATGEKTQAILLAELIKLELPVLLPFGDNQRYDLVVDIGGNLHKIQCKTGRLRHGSVRFNTCSTRSKAKSSQRLDYRGQIHAFLVWCYETNEAYWVPIDECGLVECSLRVDQKHFQSGKSVLAADHTLARFAKLLEIGQENLGS